MVGSELGGWDWHTRTVVCETDSSWGPAEQRRKLISILYRDLGGIEQGGQGVDTCMHVAGSLQRVAESNTTL